MNIEEKTLFLLESMKDMLDKAIMIFASCFIKERCKKGKIWREFENEISRNNRFFPKTNGFITKRP